MRNLPFVIWMVGAPMGKALSSYVNEYLLKHTYSDTATGIASLVVFATYIFVGTLLYEKEK